ncbi:uncharacterized protein DS421_5g147350 [Arachis hypogaea]|nr:uncharacterized protein DS421_5g147350 [Arachis hypogaea]
MTLWNERPLSLRGIIVNEQTARNAIIDMARGVAAIAAMKKRLETQPPISVDGDRVSSSATISHQLQPQRIEENGEEQGPEVHILEEDSPNHSPKKKAERTAMDRV